MIAWSIIGYQNVTEIFSQRIKELRARILTSTLSRMDRSSIIALGKSLLKCEVSGLRVFFGGFRENV